MEFYVDCAKCDNISVVHFLAALRSARASTIVLSIFALCFDSRQHYTELRWRLLLEDFVEYDQEDFALLLDFPEEEDPEGDDPEEEELEEEELEGEDPEEEELDGEDPEEEELEEEDLEEEEGEDPLDLLDLLDLLDFREEEDPEEEGEDPLDLLDLLDFREEEDPEEEGEDPLDLLDFLEEELFPLKCNSKDRHGEKDLKGGRNGFHGELSWYSG
eukprot:scaffold2727_cov275-Chaetoceros_neogracile.AAC.49